jgi:hypothetical protein
LNTVPHQYVEGVLREHIAKASELLIDLRAGFLEFPDMATLSNSCQQCMANLDALRIAGSRAIAIGREEMEGDSDVASVVAWLVAEVGDSDQRDHAECVAALLRHESEDIRQAAWWGFRLADVTRVREHLCTMASGPAHDVASAAALDILAFHRDAGQLDPSGQLHDESDEIAWLLVEAAGRIPGTWRATDLKRALDRSSRRVKEAALRASARCGLRELVAICQDATDHATSAEAIVFLGVVGSSGDLERLQRVATLARSAATPAVMANAGVVALGRLGLVRAIPTLLYLLEEPELGETAASAIERIVGESVPRGAPPAPPPGMSDDDLDEWEPVAPVDAPRAREWWAERAPRFDSRRRYQAGMCVSDDPLGPLVDQLPPAVRNDVYLRQRALVADTPDWELWCFTPMACGRFAPMACGRFAPMAAR